MEYRITLKRLLILSAICTILIIDKSAEAEDRFTADLGKIPAGFSIFNN
jgi:hypothetical protein